jgi:hypothetical protein
MTPAHQRTDFGCAPVKAPLPWHGEGKLTLVRLLGQ